MTAAANDPSMCKISVNYESIGETSEARNCIALAILSSYSVCASVSREKLRTISVNDIERAVPRPAINVKEMPGEERNACQR